MEPLTLAVGGAFVVIIFIMVLFALIKSFLVVGRPNEVIVFSGRESESGSRYIIGGSSFRWPLIEKTDRLDLRVIPVNIQTDGAYSKGGIPLKVHAIANVKISSEPNEIHNAISRFLGRDRSEIMRIAQETLEGNLRGVLATLTPEEVNEDRLRFSDELQKDAKPDFEKLGLHLDTLKIQSVSDDRDYLDSIGRKRIAEIIKQAEVAESNAMKEAEEVEAQEQGRSEVARRQAQAQIQQAQNVLRQMTAELDLKAKSEEEKADALALGARAKAEQELQKVRTDLETIRLEADVVIPARVGKVAREIIASGEAAHISEKGRATAEVLRLMSQVWAEAGDAAMDVFMLSRMEEIMKKMADAAKQVEVRQVALIDSGDGSALPNYVSSFPRIVANLFEEMKQTVGLDISGALTGDDRPASRLTASVDPVAQAKFPAASKPAIKPAAQLSQQSTQAPYQRPSSPTSPLESISSLPRPNKDVTTVDDDDDTLS